MPIEDEIGLNLYLINFSIPNTENDYSIEPFCYIWHNSIQDTNTMQDTYWKMHGANK